MALAALGTVLQNYDHTKDSRLDLGHWFRSAPIANRAPTATAAAAASRARTDTLSYGAWIGAAATAEEIRSIPNDTNRNDKHGR